MDRRLTVQRTLILDTVRDLLDHPTSQEVFEKVHEIYPSIGKATIYRNLNLLANEGKLLRIVGVEGPVHFDSTLKNHCHVECKICNKVFDIEFPLDEFIFTDIEKASGFKSIDHNLVLSGICPDCIDAALDGEGEE
jgi:Fur family ferric uptake transcriptional regulator/Fur family peroxide stress response transcriptional regulator